MHHRISAQEAADDLSEEREDDDDRLDDHGRHIDDTDNNNIIDTNDEDDESDEDNDDEKEVESSVNIDSPIPSPSSRSTFISNLPSTDIQLSTIIANIIHQSFPPFFLLVDARHSRGRRLLRWINTTASTLSSQSSSLYQLSWTSYR